MGFGGYLKCEHWGLHVISKTMIETYFCRHVNLGIKVLTTFLFFSGWIALCDAIYSLSARAIYTPFYIWIATALISVGGFYLQKYNNKSVIYHIIIAVLSGISLIVLVSHAAV